MFYKSGDKEGQIVEKAMVKDYKHFSNLFSFLSQKKESDRSNFFYDRLSFLDNVVNNFNPNVSCKVCGEDADKISIYYNRERNSRYDYRKSNNTPQFIYSKTSSPLFTYCSNECFKRDSAASKTKGRLEPIAFDSAYSDTKADTNALIEIFSNWMLSDYYGYNPSLRDVLEDLKGKRKTVQNDRLEYFFDNVILNTYFQNQQNDLEELLGVKPKKIQQKNQKKTNQQKLF
jgi:hypothetical protein